VIAWPARRRDRAGLVFVFLWFFIGGLAHFAFTEAQMRIVPPWVPWPRAAVLVSGVLEILGAVGLLASSTRRWAAWGLFALTLAVTPANVHMLQHAEQFPAVPILLLWLRLPLQMFLLWLIWRLTRRSG
jgi:uncharacterized membrane protein